MSTSIKPGGPVSPGVTEVEAPTEASATQGAQASSPLEAARTGGASQAPALEHPTAKLLARLDAGELTRAQAIEGLVAQALEQAGGAQLPPTQRTELESLLRAALEDDPTLQGLLG